MDESTLLEEIERKIRSEAKAKGIPLFQLAERIGVSEPGFYIMLESSRLK